MTLATQTKSERLTTILEKVRALGPTLRDRALEAERAGRHSDQTIADLDATGAFNIGSPAEYGGDELTVRQQLDVVSEVAKWDGSAGWTVWVGASTNWIPAGSGARVVEEVFGSPWVGPRVAGSSHFPASRGRARRVPGGWIISGGPWTFGSDSLWAPFTNLGCIATDEDGAPYLVGVQVPLEELQFLDDWKVAGMRATGSVSSKLRTDELFVPDYRGVVFSDITGGALRQRLERFDLEGAVVGLGLQSDGRHVDRHRAGRVGPFPREIGRPSHPRDDLQEPVGSPADASDAGRGPLQDSSGPADGPGQRRGDRSARGAGRRRDARRTGVHADVQCPSSGRDRLRGQMVRRGDRIAPAELRVDGHHGFRTDPALLA